MQRTARQLIFFVAVFIFANAIVKSSGCGPEEYESKMLPGCVSCPVNCDEQGADKDRCRNACGRCFELHEPNFE